MSDVPDYSDEVQAPSPDAIKKLGQLAAKMGQLMLEKEDLESKVKGVAEELKIYAENLVPELMAEIGLTEIKTKGGLVVELREEVRAALPKDEGKRSVAFQYLKDTGNDGLLTNEFVVNCGRDPEVTAQVAQVLTSVPEGTTVEQSTTLNHQSMLAFLRRELKEGKPVPLEAFGAFVQKFAKIKMGK
jgi:hypothetical protein